MSFCEQNSASFFCLWGALLSVVLVVTFRAYLNGGLCVIGLSCMDDYSV
jgi:hypothetical protein